MTVRFPLGNICFKGSWSLGSQPPLGVVKSSRHTPCFFSPAHRIWFSSCRLSSFHFTSSSSFFETLTRWLYQVIVIAVGNCKYCLRSGFLAQTLLQTKIVFWYTWWYKLDVSFSRFEDQYFPCLHNFSQPTSSTPCPGAIWTVLESWKFCIWQDMFQTFYHCTSQGRVLINTIPGISEVGFRRMSCMAHIRKLFPSCWIFKWSDLYNDVARMPSYVVHEPCTFCLCALTR